MQKGIYPHGSAAEMLLAGVLSSEQEENREGVLRTILRRHQGGAATEDQAEARKAAEEYNPENSRNCQTERKSGVPGGMQVSNVQRLASLNVGIQSNNKTMDLLRKLSAPCGEQVLCGKLPGTLFCGVHDEMITFFVPGTPVPKGSGKAFFNKNMKRAVVIQDNRERQQPWASMISYCAQQAGCALSPAPIRVILQFVMPRPKSHYGTGKNAETLKLFSPEYHTSKPDLDKLIRCVKDALTGVAWKDDSQVCELVADKMYGENPGVVVKIDEVMARVF